MLVLPTVIEAVFIPMEDLGRLLTRASCVWTRASDLTVLSHLCCHLRDRTIDETLSYATPFDAQGDDTARYASTNGRVLRQWYRRGSVVLALLLARGHCCRKITSLVRAHAWLHRDQTSRTPPDGHRQPASLRLSCRCWWNVQAHDVCLCSVWSMDWQELLLAKRSAPAG